MRTVFLFVDGLGIGRKDPEANPCLTDETGIFAVTQENPEKHLPFDGFSTGIDASLGIPGLPQSATGQTALLTGENTPQLLGRHLSGFPNRTLREVLLKKSILLQAKKMGKSAAFLNAFRPLFFELPEEMIVKLSATTVANYAAGLPFFRLEDILERRSIYQDFTNVSLLERGFEMPIYSPEEAADIMADAHLRYDFLLYEYFLTDRAGHSQNEDLARQEIHKLSRFVAHFLKQVDLGESVVLLTSDHGNIEDLSVKTHTHNPAMTLIWGKHAREWCEQLNSLVDITPFLLNVLQNSI